MAPVAIAFNCQMLTVEALPSGWALPPARPKAGRSPAALAQGRADDAAHGGAAGSIYPSG